MYQLWIRYHSDRDGNHASLFGFAARPETLRRRLIKHMTMPSHYWGFNINQKAYIQRVGSTEIIEHIDMQACYLRALDFKARPETETAHYRAC